MPDAKSLEWIANAVSSAIEQTVGEPVAFTLIVHADPHTIFLSSAAQEAVVAEFYRLLMVWEECEPEAIDAHEEH